jgi:hypothetical protein
MTHTQIESLLSSTSTVLGDRRLHRSEGWVSLLLSKVNVAVVPPKEHQVFIPMYDLLPELVQGLLGENRHPIRD